MLTMAAMKYTRREVLRVVSELSHLDRRITYQEIADRVDCSYKTVQRAIDDLKQDGTISTTSNGKGCGYKYRVNKKAS